MKIAIFLLLLAFVTVAAVPAIAQGLYNNGPTNGTTDGWTINFGFAVSDSFTLAAASNVTGLDFAAWTTPGDVLQSAEVSITSSEFGGTSYFDHTVTFTQSGCVSNQYGYNVCTESGIFSGPSLNAGTYWLTLRNASVNTGDPIYWDENSGPSRALDCCDTNPGGGGTVGPSALGSIPSESFTILGNSTAQLASSTPEPGSVLLLGSSVLALVGAGRLRKFF
jgi:hypothetical protein